MYALPVPARDHMADYAACVSHRRFRATRELLTNASGTVRAAYNAYVQAAGNASLVQPAVGSVELKRAWKTNYTLLSNTGPMSGMRGELMAATKYGLCPLCGRGNVATLDHYLPKTRYPELAVFGVNLIPACDTCNRLKGRKVGVTPVNQTLHAYLHPLPDVEILVARVGVARSVDVDFRVVRHPGMDQQTYDRMKCHFRVLQLRKHLRREANLELSDRREALREVCGGANDADAVREYLRIEARSVRASRGLNNWKTALLLGLSRSHAFCSRGFLLL